MSLRPTDVRIMQRPAFSVVGKKTWISGAENEQFARFWQQAEKEGLIQRLKEISGFREGPQTTGILLGVSCVENDPANRAFYYMIAVEEPDGYSGNDLDRYQVPASQWAVFSCRGKVPESIVQAEMFAFMEWLPSSGSMHAYAPEMEVYLPATQGEDACEFWLPITYD